MDNLRYKSVFDIIGPVMIGPSSSHTAGAARIGKIVRSIFGELPEKLEIHLYESFAKTYRGHGTDVALVAGVLGMDTDDERLPMAPQLAFEQGMEISYVPHPEEKAEHPNTARLIAKKGDRTMTVTGISIGGGMIQVTELNGFDIAISGDLTHSRVAKSNMMMLQKLGARLYFTGPAAWYSEEFDDYGHYANLDRILPELDVHMLLRVQHERHDSGESFSKEGYHNHFGKQRH